MATLRKLRTRVASIRRIQRVTNALRMVATARLRSARTRAEAARPYAEHLEEVLRDVSSSGAAEKHPLLAERDSIRRVCLVVITSDRGLCGGLNANIGRHAMHRIASYRQRLVELVVVGRKGRDYLRNRGYVPTSEHIGIFGDLRFARAVAIAGELTERYAAGKVDRIELLYSEFRSLGLQVPVFTQLLPVMSADSGQGKNGRLQRDCIFEPAPAALLARLVPRYVNFQFWQALIEVSACEQASRMLAMGNAAKNAADLIDQLTREINKKRQTSITLELMDIVGGAEAVLH